MTIQKDVVLWDNGTDKFCLFSIADEQQYKYAGKTPCLTFGVSYENSNYKGCDTFTLFDHFYSDKIREIENITNALNGTFRIDDNGADTDGYINFTASNGKITVSGQLGASFSGCSLKFQFQADQSLIVALLDTLRI